MSYTLGFSSGPKFKSAKYQNASIMKSMINYVKRSLTYLEMYLIMKLISVFFCTSKIRDMQKKLKTAIQYV